MDSKLLFVGIIVGLVIGLFLGKSNHSKKGGVQKFNNPPEPPKRIENKTQAYQPEIDNTTTPPKRPNTSSTLKNWPK